MTLPTIIIAATILQRTVQSMIDNEGNGELFDNLTKETWASVIEKEAQDIALFLNVDPSDVLATRQSLMLWERDWQD